jgi:hypothetical protein
MLPELTPEHDGRISPTSWPSGRTRHAQPYTLTLTGPAGGRFQAGGGGRPDQAQTVDAREFAAIISGPTAGTGIHRHKLPF